MRRRVEIKELAFDEEEAYRGSAPFHELSSSACDQNTSVPLTNTFEVRRRSAFQVAQRDSATILNDTPAFADIINWGPMHWRCRRFGMVWCGVTRGLVVACDLELRAVEECRP
jgi:hypothetical protein